MMMRWRDERGMSMIVALLVSFVVLVLATTVVAQSIHSLEGSGETRRRLQSINAAESGLDAWFEYLETTPSTSLSCDDLTETFSNEGSESTYTASVTFYDASETEITCSSSTPFTNSYYPSYALISSTGSVRGESDRTVETYVRLTPDYGGFGAAILANTSTSFLNSFDIYGQSADDGDIYVLTGDLAIDNQITIRGNVYVPYGGLAMSNSSTVWGTVWTRDEVDVQNPAAIEGAVLSENGDVTGDGTIGGNVTSGGDIETASLTIGGTASTFTYVSATPTQTFPTIGFTSTDWTDDGYTVNTYSGASACTNAKTFVQGSWTGNYVVRITGATACTFSVDNNRTIGVNGNLAIITDWGVSLDQRSTWNGSSGDVKQLFFISTAPAASCPASGTTSKDINVGNRTTFNTQVEVLFYTPCTANMENQNLFNGQVIATSVNIGNQFKMSYRPVRVPGITEITGFTQDISYIREVVAG
jgi:hypothetical protein